MRMAGANDPETALQAERAKDRASEADCQKQWSGRPLH